MSTSPTRPLSLLFAAVASAGLVACGGGGGSSEPVAAPAPVPVPVPGPSPAPAPAPAPVPPYPSGSAQAAVMEEINAERTRCGFGALTRDLKLEAAAQGMADYETARWNEGTGYQYVALMPHRQVAGLSAFTGATLDERLAAAGVGSWWAGEVGARQYFHLLPKDDQDRALVLLRILMHTVYHLAGVVGTYSHLGVGYGVASSAPVTLVNYPTATLVAVVGAPSDRPLPVQTDPALTWPCSGTTVDSAWRYGEWPDPFVNTNWTMPVGPPFYLRAPAGATLLVTSASVSGYAGESMLMTKDSDPHQRLSANETFLLLRSPLTAGATYTATFTGTVNGSPFTRTFRFTTR